MVDPVVLSAHQDARELGYINPTSDEAFTPRYLPSSETLCIDGKKERKKVRKKERKKKNIFPHRRITLAEFLERVSFYYSSKISYFVRMRFHSSDAALFRPTGLPIFFTTRTRSRFAIHVSCHRSFDPGVLVGRISK